MQRIVRAITRCCLAFGRKIQNLLKLLGHGCVLKVVNRKKMSGAVANFNSLEEADKLKKRLAKGEEVLVEIVQGPLAGTIAKILTITRKHFDRHDYQLMAPGASKAWWQRADTFEEAQPHAVPNYSANPSFVVQHRDNMNQIITNGTVIFFMRASRASCGVEVVLATVKKITQQGLEVLPFKVNNRVSMHNKNVLVRRPDLCMMVDSKLPSLVMMEKLMAL